MQYLNVMQRHYKIRYENSTLEFQKFSKNPIQIARYLDDISNYFYREQDQYVSKIENYTDEISYLELKKVKQ